MRHASMALGQNAYVACGEGYRGYLRSVEMLSLKAKTWELIDIPELTPRDIPIFC